MPEWYWKARDRATGEERKFFSRGTQLTTPAEVKDHVSEHYVGLQFIEAWPADKDPGIVTPVPARFFQRGFYDLLRQELGGARARPGRSIALPNPFKLLNSERSQSNGQIRPGPLGGGGSGGLVGDRLQLVRARRRAGG